MTKLVSEDEGRFLIPFNNLVGAYSRLLVPTSFSDVPSLNVRRFQTIVPPRPDSPTHITSLNLVDRFEFTSLASPWDGYVNIPW